MTDTITSEGINITDTILRIFSLAFFCSVLTIMFIVVYVIAGTRLLLSLMVSSAGLTVALLGTAISLVKKKA